MKLVMVLDRSNDFVEGIVNRNYPTMDATIAIPAAITMVRGLG